MATVSTNTQTYQLDELMELVTAWRTATDRGDATKAATAVDQFNNLAEQLCAAGWNGEGFGPADALPDELMPTWLRFFP